MSDGLDVYRAVEAVRAAASAAGDTSGNCDAAQHLFELGNIGRAAEELEWAEENARAILATAGVMLMGRRTDHA